MSEGGEGRGGGVRLFLTRCVVTRRHAEKPWRPHSPRTMSPRRESQSGEWSIMSHTSSALSVAASGRRAAGTSRALDHRASQAAGAAQMYRSSDAVGTPLTQCRCAHFKSHHHPPRGPWTATGGSAGAVEGTAATPSRARVTAQEMGDGSVAAADWWTGRRGARVSDCARCTCSRVRVRETRVRCASRRCVATHLHFRRHGRVPGRPRHDDVVRI